MLRLTSVQLPFKHSDAELERAILDALGIANDALLSYNIHKRSIDARKRRNIQFTYSIDVEVQNEESVLKRLQNAKNVSQTPDMTYRSPALPNATGQVRPVVVGAGPCGLFAALLLAQMGLRPILLERGKRIDERSKDVQVFWKTGQLNPASNALFGEGGAGAFSDGKLTTQIKDRENRCRKVLTELVAAGAPDEILYLRKPHIGTDRLVGVVANLRETIKALGGEVRFERQVTGLSFTDGAVRGVTVANGESIETTHVVLAIGHSARDTFQMLYDGGVRFAAKPFSIGVRVEHPQVMTDRAQYGECAGDPRLGPAEYQLVHHCKNGRSVYTFCMCPGGQVIAASSEPGQVVTNGMSAYNRNQPNANAAVLVGVRPEDFGADHPLAGVAFQRRFEEKAFELGGGGYKAPAQLLGDFLAARASTSLGAVVPSYAPGVTLCDLRPCLPAYAAAAMCEAFPALDKKLRGFAMPDAVLTGVETRSSSPVRILRSKDGVSESTQGLYPAGEGAGYAGGIVSSAVDGIRAAESVANSMREGSGLEL